MSSLSYYTEEIKKLNCSSWPDEGAKAMGGTLAIIKGSPKESTQIHELIWRH